MSFAGSRGVDVLCNVLMGSGKMVVFMFLFILRLVRESVEVLMEVEVVDGEFGVSARSKVFVLASTRELAL